MNENYSLILREIGLKATPKRLAILEELAANLCYMTPEEIWGKLKKRFKRAGLPTIYRNLEELSEKGVISKIVHPDRKLSYYLCRNKEHHHHFICLSCHKVDDITYCHIETVQMDIENKLEGKVLSHIMQINGICNTCLKNKEFTHEGGK